jgi:hypothetical protein
MEEFNGIKIIELSEKYQRDIFGLGEVYEIMSVERMRRRLLNKYGGGKIYLASNKNHGGKGITLKELEFFLKEAGIIPAEKGFIDSPPWPSSPLKADDKKSYGKFIIATSKIIFWFLIRLESLWEGSKKSHMIYIFSQKK